MDNSAFLIAMGKRITERRKVLSLSQEQLAEKAEVSPQLISTAERGLKALRPDNLLKISTSLGVSTDYLLTGEVIDKDFSIILGQLNHVSSGKLRTIEEIIHCSVRLCDD